jgi:pilus assembly protein Flp/PilA
MKSPAARLMNFLRDESGAAAAEYGMLIAALVVLVALAAATLGDTLTVVIRDAADCVEVGCL